jgi:integrase
VRRAFGSAVARAGIKGKVSFHVLRKTGADWLRQSGVTLEAVQKLGGWASPDVLLAHYRNPAAAELRAAAGRLDELVRESS